MTTQPAVRYPEDLPACCTPQRLRLPTPDRVHHHVNGGMHNYTAWELGLDHWNLDVGVGWWEEGTQTVAEALAEHTGDKDLPNNEDATAKALAAHGLTLDQQGMAWVGTQEFMVARLFNEMSTYAGREVLASGAALWQSADDQAGDLDALVAPVVDLNGGLWNDSVIDQWGDEAEMTDTAILLRAVHITPVMRGHGLGAWAAAHAITLFDSSRSLVITKAAPLSRQDAIPGLDDDDRADLTSEQQALWDAEQNRLARHWRNTLGFKPLPEDPTILTWCSAYQNPTLGKAMSRYAI